MESSAICPLLKYMFDHVKALYRELQTEAPATDPQPQTATSLSRSESTPGKIQADTPTQAGAGQQAISYRLAAVRRSTVQTRKQKPAAPQNGECTDKIPLPPREKLERCGVQSLDDAELLCLLLGSGSREQPVSRLAARLLPQLLQQPFGMNLESLLSIKGMGLGKSSAILAAMELARRFPCPKLIQFHSPESIHRQIAHFADRQENLVAVNLNGACEALSIRLITRGTVNRSLIHPREVFANAVREQANSIVVAHNHPSGHLNPSKEDMESTRRLLDAAQILGIKLLDHIIFSATSYLSFAQQGLIENDRISPCAIRPDA